MDLAEMIRVARRDGWATSSGVLAEVTRQARELHLDEVPNRRGEGPVSVLRPTGKADSHPNSLSAQVGLGAQPLHTDGAHHPSPPSILVLVAERPNSTPTWLRRVNFDVGIRSGLGALMGGMFLVGDGPSSFFAPAWHRGHGVRFDPGCMKPCDARSRAAAEFLSNADGAMAHEWSEAQQVLVIDNTRTLHARGAVENSDWDRELVRIAYRRPTQ